MVLDDALVPAELGEQRGGDEDRGVTTGEHTDEQRHAEVLQRAGTQDEHAGEQQGCHREHTDDRRVDRADEHLVEGPVDRLAIGVRGSIEVTGEFANLVEHHDGVVERVTQDRQHTDEGCRGERESDQGVHTEGDDEVVEQAEHGRHRHLPFPEIRPDEQHDEHEEDHQGLDGLLGDLAAPLTAHLGVGDRGLTGPGCLGNALLEGGDLRGVEGSGLDLHLVGSELDDLGAVQLGQPGVEDGTANVVGARAGGRDVGPELHAAPEVDAQVESAEDESAQGHQDDDRRDDVPALAVRDELVGELAGVELVGESGFLTGCRPPFVGRGHLGVLVLHVGNRRIGHLRPPRTCWWRMRVLCDGIAPCVDASCPAGHPGSHPCGLPPGRIHDVPHPRTSCVPAG